MKDVSTTIGLQDADDQGESIMRSFDITLCLTYGCLWFLMTVYLGLIHEHDLGFSQLSLRRRIQRDFPSFFVGL